MERIRIGCSGWNYKHWRERFYPKGLPVRSWFAFYAEHFDTVEINNSFYMLPKGETFDKWQAQAPPDFRYAVKANRFLTQAKKLKDCEEPLERMMPLFRRLGPTLGPVLYQLPPRLKLNLERLETFLQLVPKDVINVFEFARRAGTCPRRWRCWSGTARHSAPTTCRDRRVSGGRWGRSPTSGFTAARVNIGADIRTRGCCPGRLGGGAGAVRA
jgi:uncharacterized protein YecE (DUF72 family)